MIEQRRVTVLVAVLALAVGMLIPLAAWAVMQTFDDVPPADWAFDDVEWLVAAGLTNGCSDEPPLYCPDDPVTRREFAAFTHRSADKLMSQVHHAKREAPIPLLPNDKLAEATFYVPEPSTLSVSASANATYASPPGAPGNGAALNYADVQIWIQVNDTSCNTQPALTESGLATVAPVGIEPFNAVVTIDDGAQPVGPGETTVTLCGWMEGDGASIWRSGFSAIVTPLAMSTYHDSTPVPAPPVGNPRR